MKSKNLIASKKLFTLVVFLLFSCLILGSDQDIPVRSFNETEMSNYAANDDFNYMNLTIQPPSIWQRLQWWFGALIASIFDNPNTPWLSNVLFYVILVAVLGLAIYYIIRLKYGSGFSSESKHFSLANSGLVRGNEKIDYDQLIKEAIEENQFKLAIRYLYLKTLHFLHSKKVIAFKDWKSPYDYEKELDSGIVTTYRSLTGLFEHAWYGDFNVSTAEFEEGRKLANTIESKVDEKG